MLLKESSKLQSPNLLSRDLSVLTFSLSDLKINAFFQRLAVLRTWLKALSSNVEYDRCITFYYWNFPCVNKFLFSGDFDLVRSSNWSLKGKQTIEKMSSPYLCSSSHELKTETSKVGVASSTEGRVT